MYRSSDPRDMGFHRMLDRAVVTPGDKVALDLLYYRVQDLGKLGSNYGARPLKSHDSTSNLISTC